VNAEFLASLLIGLDVCYNSLYPPRNDIDPARTLSVVVNSYIKSDIHLCNYTKTIILVRLSEYWLIFT
jgi:hypothetical protein